MLMQCNSDSQQVRTSDMPISKRLSAVGQLQLKTEEISCTLLIMAMQGNSS